MDTEILRATVQKAKRNTGLKYLSCNISKLQTTISESILQGCEILTLQITCGEFCQI